jgi:segregation and condensation protein B
MPDEEALSEEDPLIDELGNLEDAGSFVTDFVGDETATLPAVPVPSLSERSGDVDEGEYEDEAVSVFAYTRAPKPMEDPEAFDRDAVQAAVRKLRAETRVPQQPMHTWRDGE